MDRIVRLLCLGAGVGVGIALAQDSLPDPGSGKAESVLFEPMPVVEAASLHTQSLMDAPASVTVITDEEIRRRGYRTLAEALGDVRGLYITNDRSYQALGVRGFGIPGDYSTRLVVMINGHSLTENVYVTAGYFGQDFGLDMDLIKRIEIIRGPSSALYGSNGMFATINIVTKSPVEYQPLRASAETDSLGERKAQLSTSQYLGQGVNLLMSVSVFNNTGTNLYFPQYDTPAANNGWAVNMDGEKGYHAFTDLIWRNWSFVGYLVGRDQTVPTAWYGAVFNDRGTSVADSRGFVDAAYQRNVGASGRFRWRTYYDEYRSTNRIDFAPDSPVLSAMGINTPYTMDGRQGGQGERVGTELDYRFQIPHLGYLTIGSEADWDLEARLRAYLAAPVYVPITDIDYPGRSFAVFIQQEWELSRHWKVDLGGRLDLARYHDPELSPRIGIIYQPTPATALKFLYGSAFRNPSVFEEFYSDGATQIGNGALRPERMRSFEGVFEKRVAKNLDLSADIYHYGLEDLIAAVPLSSVLRQYQNSADAQSMGFELEASGPIRSRLRADASMAFQGQVFDYSTLLGLNSPRRVGKLALDGSLFHDRLWASGALQYLSDRQTLTGSSVPAAYLVNLTLTSRRLPDGWEVQSGIRNLLNRQYWDPGGVGQSSDRIEQDGRSFFVRVSWGVEAEVKPAKQTSSTTLSPAQTPAQTPAQKDQP